MGFMARLLALCSLPRTNPGNRLRYVRQNGPYSLVMTAGGKTGLPFGNVPRLLPGLGGHRSSTNPKPRAGPGSLAVRVHAASWACRMTVASLAVIGRGCGTRWTGSFTPVSS